MSSTEPLLAEGTVRDQVATTITKLADYRGLRTDTALAEAMNATRSNINAYKNAVTSPNVEWLASFAAALGVEPYVLLMPTNQAFQWTIEHAPNPELAGSIMSERRRGPRATSAKGSTTHTRVATREKRHIERIAAHRHLHLVEREHAA